jgi:hypothetical protein
MSGNQRILVLALAALVAVVGFFVARQSGDDGSASDNATTVQRTIVDTPGGTKTTRTVTEKPAAPRPELIVVEDGEPAGGVRQLRFKKGGTVDFRVRSDQPDELHVHGYDIEKELPAGRAVRVRFPADIDGRFEVELHHAGTQVARLEVAP